MLGGGQSGRWWGWEGHEAKAVRPPLGTTPIKQGPPSPLFSSPLLPSQDLFSRAPLPYRMFGVGHWMPASCVLGGDWQQSEGQTACRMQGGGGGGGWRGVGVLDKHITWNREAHSIVSWAISAVSCYELCLSYKSTGAAFMTFLYTGWAK